MKVSQIFTNNLFRSDDFDKKGRVFVIESVEMEKVGTDEKMVVHFRDTDKCLPLNKTNALEIAEILGEDDTDDWTGGRIRIYKGKTMYLNKPVDCMLVGEPSPAPADTQAASAAGG